MPRSTPLVANSTPRLTEPAGGVLGFAGFRVALVLFAVLVPGFWVWYQPELHGFTDPIELRLALSGCALALLVGTYVSARVRRHVFGLFSVLLWGLTAWFIPIVYVNRLEEEYVIGLLLILVASSFAMAIIGGWQKRVRRAQWYLGCALGGTVVISVLTPDPEIERMQFVSAVVAIVATAYLCARVTAAAEGRLAVSEAAARASDERFRRVFDNVQDVLFEIDAGGRWTLLSPAWKPLTGYAVEESLGRSFFDFVYEDDRPDALERTQALFREGQEVFDEALRYRTRSGEVRWVSVRARSLYSPDGVPSGAAGTLTDVTDTVNVEAERRARQRAEELLRLKSSLLDTMSHELRTPLTSVLGFAEVLADEIEGEHAEFASHIHAGASRLLDTLNSVLDLAQLEGRGLSLQQDRTDAGAELAETAGLLRPLAEQKGLALTVRVPEEGVPVVLDRHALQRVLTNLVGNAIKFTPAGRVAVGLAAGAERVRFEVEDTGVGISEAFLPHLFEPFRQASEGLARSHEGSGLGLSITKQLVELMGGTIAVESEVGAGTRFTVEVPRWGVEAERAEPGADLGVALAA